MLWPMNEWPALPTIRDVCVIQIICTSCRGCGFCSAVLNCHKAALVSGPSLVSLNLKLSVCIKQHRVTCFTWLGFLGEIML